MRASVTTGSRLHFGLLHLPPAEPWPEYIPGTDIPARYFGGIGMMVEQPHIKVMAKSSEQWDCGGRLSDRAKSIATQLGHLNHAVSIWVCPPEHVGLGVGTQLSLAVGTALTENKLSPTDLAQRLSRGLRSAVGIHGFTHGGFIVDAGKATPSEIGNLATRCAFPSHWHILLLTPKLEPSWYGQTEKEAFSRLIHHKSCDDVMDRLITTTILPSLRVADLATFGPAITEYNVRAGELFRPAQNDRYSHPVIGLLVDELVKLGFSGAGQTSWGPTVFALTDDMNRIEYFNQHVVPPVSCSAVITHGKNDPAQIVIEPN
jgi:beta-ribofuranosylaminobenzene 5'-phosphate synthase